MYAVMRLYTLGKAEDLDEIVRRAGEGFVPLVRAVPGFDTSEVAVALGGGGHRLASGATVREPLATLVPRVVAMLQDAVRAGARLVV